MVTHRETAGLRGGRLGGVVRHVSRNPAGQQPRGRKGHSSCRCAGKTTRITRTPAGQRGKLTVGKDRLLLEPASRNAQDLPRPEEDGSVDDGLPLPTVLEGAERFRQWLGERWSTLSSRHRIVFASSLAFVIDNMLKVNMSVAIVPMARDFGWGASVSGLVQSGFFWGYILAQLPGGYLSSKFGGRRVLPMGIGLCSMSTAALPLLAATLPGLFLTRVGVGLGEAVAPSAITDMVAKTTPRDERSRAMSFIFGGLHVGSVVGLLTSPMLIQQLGWPSVFYAFGGAGIMWSLWWEQLMADMQQEDPECYKKMTESFANSSTDGSVANDGGVPIRAILRSNPVRALMFTHYCNNWFYYTMLAWLPSYFTDTLSLDLSQAAYVSLLPPIAGIVASGVAGSLGDALVARGWKTAVVRKVAQCTAFLGPAICLTVASFTDSGLLDVGLMTTALGLASFSVAGLYCNHQDLSPKYSSFLLGLTNTSGSIPGIVGVFFTGYLLDQTGSWPIALFTPSIVFFIAGSIIFTLYGRSSPQKFRDNQPFEWEKKILGAIPWKAE